MNIYEYLNPKLASPSYSRPEHMHTTTRVQKHIILFCVAPAKHLHFIQSTLICALAYAYMQNGETLAEGGGYSNERWPPPMSIQQSNTHADEVPVFRLPPTYACSFSLCLSISAAAYQKHIPRLRCACEHCETYKHTHSHSLPSYVCSRVVWHICSSMIKGGRTTNRVQNTHTVYIPLCIQTACEIESYVARCSYIYANGKAAAAAPLHSSQQNMLPILHNPNAVQMYRALDSTLPTKLPTTCRQQIACYHSLIKPAPNETHIVRHRPGIYLLYIHICICYVYVHMQCLYVRCKCAPVRVQMCAMRI